MKKKILLLILLVLVIGSAALIISRKEPASSGGLKVSGTIEVTATELSFKIPGRLARRLVDEGEMVQAGQIVAQLEDDELKSELNARNADYRAGKAALADLQAGSRREEIAQGEAALARIKAETERLAKDAVRTEELFRREVIALKDVEAARAARDSSAAAQREAEQHLKLLKSGPRPDAVHERRARVESAEAALDLAKTRLSQSVLTAGHTGVVLAKHAEPGEMLVTGSPVITIGKMEEVWLRAYIPENELGRVKLGQTASVTIDGRPDKVYAGKVTFLSSQAEFTPKNVQTEKERVKLVYRIKITLANPEMELKPGMPADAVISTGNQKR